MIEVLISDGMPAQLPEAFSSACSSSCLRASALASTTAASSFRLEKSTSSSGGCADAKMRPARGTTALGACQALVTSRTVQNEAMARPQCATAAAPAAAAAQEHERRHRLAISRAACERNQRFAVRLLRLFLPVLAPPFNDRRVCLEVARLQQQRPLGTAVSCGGWLPKFP